MGKNKKSGLRHRHSGRLEGKALFLGFLTTFLTVIMFSAITNGLSINTGNLLGTGASGTLIQVFCNIYNTISTFIFILALMLMVLGGAIYAGAHLLPAQSRGQFQGYAMGMVIGGVIGVIIVIAAPYIIGVLESVQAGNGGILGAANNALGNIINGGNPCNNLGSLINTGTGGIISA
jgi:hypothetical protein